MEKILVLMSTYNGEKYIEEQLESLAQQEDVEVSLIVRDDGSTDNTTKILELWKNRMNLKWYVGKNMKPAMSFMDLLEKANGYEFYAFCDQDDIWDKNKLITAVTKMKEISNAESLYFSASTLVDENLEYIKKRSIEREYTFTESLMRNNVQGATMVFNDALLRRIKEYQPNVIDMHDSWIYKVCKGVGGNVICDSNSYIKYRQHENNVVGASGNLKTRIISKITHANEKKNINYNVALELYNGYHSVLTKDNKDILLKFINYKKNIKSKYLLLKDKRINVGKIYQKVIFTLDILFGAY